MKVQTQQISSWRSDDHLIQLTKEVVDEIESALKMEPHQLGKEVDSAEVRVARLRDCLIEKLRQEKGVEAAKLKPVLDNVNAALSFIVGVEYPATGIHREYLKKARSILKQIQKGMV